MNTAISILFLFLCTNISAQTAYCSPFVKLITDDDNKATFLMQADQKIVDSLGNGIILGIKGTNNKGTMRVTLVDSTDCLPYKTRMVLDLEGTKSLTFSVPTYGDCTRSGKISFMDIDFNKPGLYQIIQFRRLRYFKIRNIIITTRAKTWTLPLTQAQKDYILNFFKCIIS